MVDVIDFKDLSTHLVEQHDPSVLSRPSTEQLAKEKKYMGQFSIFSTIFIILVVVVYIFSYHDRPTSGAEADAYQSGVVPTFSSIRQEFKNLKEITCDEGKREDCISYTLTFHPLDDGSVAEGATPSDVNRLGEYFNVILQSKLKFLTSRKENLTFKIISINVSSTEGESKVTYSCFEYYGQIKCNK